MKKERRKISMLKKILIIAFIISLLSNHMLILGEVTNIALAAEVEWSSDFTSDVKVEDNVQQEESDDPNSTQENSTVENTVGEVVPPDKEVQSSENVVAEAEPQNIVSEENNVEDDVNKVDDGEEILQEELSEEEIKAIQAIKANTELQINKLIKYDNENGKGTVADVTFKVKVDAKEYKVSALDVNFNPPNLSGILPTSYKVEECSDNIEFSQDENGLMSLNIKEVTNNKEETIRLFLVYSEETFTATELNMTGDVRVEIAGQEVLGNFSETKETVENTDPIATYGLTTDTSSKYKGYLYANTLTEKRKDIPYTTIDVVEIKDANFIDEIIVENKIDKIVTDSKEIDLVNMVTYKSTSVSVDEFKSTLGEKGYIEIYNNIGEKIGELNSTSKIKNNRYIFYYDKDVDQVTFKLKGIESNATLNIKNDKAIKGSDTFSSEQVKSFKTIKSETVNKIAKIVNDNEIIVQSIYAENNINLEETESKMTLKMNTDDFITTETNEVTFEVTLKTNEEKYELFRNPTISIELPSAVQNVEIKSVNLMYKNGLSLGAWDVVKNEQGANIIQVSLEGTQKEYSPGTMLEGTNVLITADLDLNKITANGKSAVKLRYTNEAGTNISYILEGKDCVDLEVNYVSRSGILKESKIQNFNAESDILVSYDDKAVVGSIKAEDTARVATVSTVIMNNYSKEIENVEIIGKIPSIGNTKDGVSLNTTFDTTLAGPVSLNGLVGKVYYSNNEDETKESDNWNENITDYSQVKSFKVVLENDNMKVGEKIELSYNINIPENVGYNASAYNLFTTYYDYKNQEIEDSSILGLESEIKAIELDDCQVVEETPELSVGTQVTRSGFVLEESDEVNKGQILKYNVVLTNKTSQPITNINVKGCAENANSYYMAIYENYISSTDGSEVTACEWIVDTENKHPYEEVKIESLAPGETKVVSYQVKVKDSNSEVFGKVLISADGIEEKEYQTIKNKTKDAKVELVVKRKGIVNINDMNIYTTDFIGYITSVKNISNEDLKNVKVNIMLPDCIEYNQEETLAFNDGIDIIEQETSIGKLLTVTIWNLAKDEEYKILLSAQMKSMELSIPEKEFTIMANCTIDNQEHYSNEYINKLYQGETSFNVEYTANHEDGAIVNNGDNIKYNIKITNSGIASGRVKIVDYLPFGLKINSAKMTLPTGEQEELEITEYKFFLTDYFLAPGQQLIIDIDSTVNVEDLRSTQSTIVNKLEITPSEYLNEFDELVFHVNPSQIPQEPEYGVSDEEEIVEEEIETPEPLLPGETTESEEEPKEEVKQEENKEEPKEEVKQEENKEEPKEEVKQEENKEEPKEEVKQEENKEEPKEETKQEENKEEPKEEPKQDNEIEVIDQIDVEKTVKYSISGKSWLDKNQNESYDESEELSSINVMLFRSDSSETLDITDSNIYKTTVTNEDGDYVFANLESGKYVVVFDYDNTMYDISSYQVTKKASNQISNVIAKQLTLNSNEKTYAVSDIVELSTTNINNINMGLKENEDFDMSISTYVSKVIIENNEGVKTEEFTSDDPLAKIEIHSKQLESSRLTIEYKVIVTNNGKTSGYVNQIATTLANGLVFDPNSTSNWQMGDNNVIYSSSLNKELIEPGESRELQFIVTKDMSDGATGTYKTTAQIIDMTNELQLVDYDVKNDISDAELLITVKTGAVYYVLVIVIALMIAFIAMLIVSKLIKDDKNKVNFINKIIIIVSLIVIIALCLVIKVYADYSGKDFATQKLADYLSRTIKLEVYTTIPTDYEKIHTMQCIEGANVSNAPDWKRRTLSVADISGRDFSTKSINNTKGVTGTSDAAGVLGYLAYLAEEARQDKEGTVWDYKELFVDYLRKNRSGVNNVLKITISSGADNSGHSSNEIKAAETYVANLKAGGSVNKLDDVKKLQYNADYDAFGAIYIEFPKGAKLEISSDNGENWEKCTNVVTSNGTVKFNYENCNKKKFYIPMSVLKDYNLSKVKVRISAEQTAYKARLVPLFGNDKETQNQVIMRGKKSTTSSDVAYTVEELANVSVKKEVVKISNKNGAATVNAAEGDYANRGDRVRFKITVENKSAIKTKLDLTDTYNTSQYEFVKIICPDDTEITTDPKGNWKKTITVEKGKTVYYVVLRVKSDITADANTKLNNTAEISNFKFGTRTVPNKDGNTEKSSTYVRCKQYRISVDKSILSITNAAGTAKSSKTSAEVGDIITYKFVLKNNGGSKSDAYGQVKYVLSETIPTGFSVQTASGWTKDSSGKYTYSGTLDSGATKEDITIKVRVTEDLLNTKAVNKENTVTITSTKNRNDIDIKSYLLNSTLEDKATVKILGYNFSISKTITKQNGVEVKDLTLCEIGDELEYTITVKNTGSGTADFGQIYNFKLKDTFKSDQLQFISASGTNWTNVNNTEFTYAGPLAAGKTATLKINLKVILESKQKIKITNTATINSAENNNGIKLTHILPKESTAVVEYQTYDMDVWKYITSHMSKSISDRTKMTNDEKYKSPIEVEQRDYVEYKLVVKNSGTTLMNNVTFVDTLENGITYNSTVSMKKFNSSGTESGSADITENVNGNTITYTYPGELKGGEYFEVVLKCDITMSNMHLLNLKNEVSVLSIHNRNGVDLIEKDLINYVHKENQDYVRMKDLLVKGSVWIDANKNGKMEDKESKLEGIQVILHDDTNGKIATTYTNSEGVYSFAETNGTKADGKSHNKKMVNGGSNAGRIVKATNRDDATGNYTTDSKYINYYLEFNYNGARYMSTVYSGDNGMANIQTASDNKINTEYFSDSNAYEFSDIREALNKKLETIEYNTGINGIVENGSNLSELSYIKDGHIASLDVSRGSSISAYTFINKNSAYGDGLKNKSNINMLFLSQTGETEYLKYMNLGLVQRELDLSANQDVYSIKTTVNGEEMTYMLGQANKSPYKGTFVLGGERNPLNYQFKLYAADYYYKHTQYQNADVKEYKEDTELNTEITYKMSIKNNDVKDEYNVYTKIREIADYYSSDFIKYDPANNTKIVKVKNEDGYLEEKLINKVEAWYEFTDKNNVKSTGPVVLSNSPIYPKHAKVNVGTNSSGKSKYNVVYLSGFDNIDLSQGNSFDIYIKFVVDTKDGTDATDLKLGEKNNIIEINAYSTYYKADNKPAGYIDKNSNPGSLGLGTNSSNKNGLENANIEDITEYEDDTYRAGITLSIDERLERTVQGTVWDDARSDSTGQDGTTQYVGNGIMNIGGDNKIAEAESNYKKKGNRLIVDESKDSVVKGVNANLVEIVKVPKNGQDRIYEESIKTSSSAITSARTNTSGKYQLKSFIPGDYIIRFNYGESVQDVTYNGQEYKSTTYYNIENQVTNQPESGDNILAKLEEPGRSDARDDELRRLEVIAYSEIVNNRKTEEAQKVLPEEYSENFMKNTSMVADTATFPIRAEKETYEVEEYSFDEYTESINRPIRYNVENIDFGLEYRPEVNVSIEEFLSEIKLTTSDGNVLANIKFDNVYEEVNGVKTEKIIGTELNKETSIGEENLQYLPTINDVKGLAFLNVDTDILQGCTVDVTYVFCVNNSSEVDRISKSLAQLKYKADALLMPEYSSYCDDNYTAAGTARNALYDEFFETNGATFRVKDRTSANYYGKYLGNAYYTGSAGTNDVVAELKIDKILDYVDNNMTMEANKNVAENKFWTTMTDQELLDQGLISESVYTTVEERIKENGEVKVKQHKKLMDVNGIVYNTDTRNNLAVSVDDKISSSDTQNTNKSLSKFLLPQMTDANSSSGSIYMTASKVVSAESDTEDMRYDNSSEIIQYTSATGRITGLSTTVGNLDTEIKEHDEAEAPTVNPTPPTGLDLAKYYASLAKDQLIMVATIIAIIIVAIILKKKLKNVTFKKFYK